MAFNYVNPELGFSINFGFLAAGPGAGNTGYESNMLCKINNAFDENINYKFQNAEVDDSFTKMTIIPSASLKLGSITGLGSYRIKCIGGRAGDGTCTSDACGIGSTYFEDSFSTKTQDLLRPAAYAY